jgi:type IV pilus assembly protein PilF
MAPTHRRRRANKGITMEEVRGCSDERGLRAWIRIRRIGWAFAAVPICIFMFTACAMDQAARREQSNMHINIGTAYIEAGDHNGAMKELLAAEKFTPDEPRVHYFLAIAYHGKGFQEKAIEECKTAIALKPDYSEAHNFLGTMYMGVGNNALAIESFNNALKNIHYDAPYNALYNLGRVYYRMGDYTKAMSRYQEAIAKDARGELAPLVENGMGKVSYSQGDFIRAAAYFKKSAELAPSYVESHYWLGECYLKTGRPAEAKKSFEFVIKLAPASDFSQKAKENLERIKN